MDFRKGTELNDRYVIHDVIGSGGAAAVWKASDKQLNRDVALKRLLKYARQPEGDVLSRVLDEARKSARLVHTNIVQVYDIIEVEREPLIVMEFVDGQSLNDLLRDQASKGEVLPLDSAISLLRDVLSGVSYAHANNICHRDLSPMNILLTRGGIPKIADFGIARVVTQGALPPAGSATATQGGTGNPNFMSPEQARGESADFTSDLFMVGIIGYLLLSGRHPFAHSSGLFSIPELIKNEHTPEPLTPLTGLTTAEQRLFREYAAVVVRLLHRERAGRFASGLEAMEAIEAVTPGLDCPACGEKVPEHHKFCGFCSASLALKPSPVAPSESISDDPNDLVEEGFQFTRQKLFEKAVQKYRTALKIEAGHQKAIWNLGFALNRLGRYDEAVTELSNGLALAATHGYRSAMLYERSFALANLKCYDEAIRDISEAILDRPESDRFLWQRARIHSFRGEHESAKRDALEVLRLNPGHPGALRLQGEVA